MFISGSILPSINPSVRSSSPRPFGARRPAGCGILRHLDIETSHQAFERLREAAEQQGKTIYDELAQAHRERLAREREKGEYAFAARRKAIERIGLPQVRNHRLSLLEQEEERFREQLERRAQILPEMAPLLLVRVEGNHG